MRIIATILSLFISTLALAQTTIDYALQITAEVQKLPAQIKLNWKSTVTKGNLTIFRKTKQATSWGSPIATLSATATSFTDNNVSSGNGYEYYLYVSDSTQPKGYIYAGIEAPAAFNRGAILLLVDSTFSDSCSVEIAQLQKDLSGDGWEVYTEHIGRSADVNTVKGYVINTFILSNRLKAVYILGHVAVPYSGNINPDAHADHKGAWPADVFYGDIDGTWNDATVNNTTSGNPLNHNIPGDGKFDHDHIASELELQVGRVDFYDMPAFNKTEVEMMRNYLNKAHQYKTGELNVVKRALIDDNFTSMPEAFAANGWRNFSPLVGTDSVFAKDYITTLINDSYQWALGCGPGSYTNCSGVGNTTNFTTQSMNSIFNLLFGSYFGDWNYRNNFLRAPLCSDDPSLASIWAGRPNWQLHHMALGENIGYSTMLSQNNNSLYYTYFPQMSRMVHIALMGDPSLRTEYVLPVSNVTTTQEPNAGARISWTASPESGIAGYYISRASEQLGQYQLRANFVTDTTYVDSFGSDSNTYWYMVQAVKLQSTPSGSYYNYSIGQTDSGSFDFAYWNVNVKSVAGISNARIFPNPANSSATLQATTTKATDVTIILTDLQGRTLQNQQAAWQPGVNTYAFDLSMLPSGIYIVNMRTAEGNTILKLVRH